MSDYTEVTVLNVGAGSCTVVEHPTGHLTMVDVNDGGDQRSYESTPTERPLTDPISWFTARHGKSLFRFVLSHPDRDHMAGLRRVLVTGDLSADNFWDLPHKRTRKEDDFPNQAAWHDWLFYEALRNKVSVPNVTWPTVVLPMRGDARDFWRQDSVEVLSPTPDQVAAGDKADNYNDASYVLRFRHGPTSSVLLASDVEEPAWNNMLDAGVELRANVLIASHHGRKSGFSELAMDAIRPEVVIVSTAKLKAEHDGISLYKARCKNVLSTRVDGDVAIRMYDDGAILVFDQESKVLVHLYDK